MKNKLSDLNNHLFAQLERLGNEQISDDSLTKEIERSKAISGLAKDVIANARLVLDAHVAVQENQLKFLPKEIVGE